MIEKGAEVNRTNFAGYNALLLIIRNENMELADKLKLIKLLIDKGIDINWLNIYGETALCVALSRAEKEIAELARCLGRAVMITYMLHDVKNDAKSGRFYIPRDILEVAQVAKDEPRNMVEDKNLFKARQFFFEQAERGFNNAERLFSHMSKRDVMPLRLIKNVSQCQFEMMKNRGREIISPKPKINLVKSLDIMYQTMFK